MTLDKQSMRYFANREAILEKRRAYWGKNQFRNTAHKFAQ